jgi:hypothetical protein
VTTEITHTVTLQWQGLAGGGLSASVAKSAGAELNQILAIVAETNDQEFDLDFLYANLVSIYMLATQDLTIETNAADATGGNTIALKAGVPFWWAKDSGVANPFTANVTKIFVSNAGAAAQLDIRILYDSAA